MGLSLSQTSFRPHFIHAFQHPVNKLPQVILGDRPPVGGKLHLSTAKTNPEPCPAMMEKVVGSSDFERIFHGFFHLAFAAATAFA
jgi:hypothetical protein